MATTDYDALVIGAGHNGLVCAAYLAKGGLRTLLIEARADVGGTATSTPFGGGIANICNCDHLTFRTTPVIDELGLAGFGLRYLDVDPAQFNATWSDAPAWSSFHSLERTLDGLAASHPGEVDGYRRYAAAAMPAVRLVFDAANNPPSLAGITRRVLARRGRGVATLLRWSRMSAADVMRRYFTTEALRAPAMAVGPMVWGISPEAPGSGLGALTYAMRHVGRLGRPVGGSRMVPDTIRAAFVHAGGELRLDSPVAAITCAGEAVRGVRLVDGTEITAARVISACNPHDTFLTWLENPPPQATTMVERWRRARHDEGYESKIDAVVGEVPRVRTLPASVTDEQLGGTFVLAPTLADMARGAAMIADGAILERPALIGNTPSVADPTVAPPGGHMFSLEALFTPYRLRGGWENSLEPRRWLEHFATMVQPGWLDHLGEWRAMTPDRYEREFFLPAGHATSFAGGPLAAMMNRQPELTRYRTPIRGLYLTGAATFPGAGVWGASGRNAALVVLGEA